MLYADLWGQADPLGAVNTALATHLRAIQTRAGRTAIAPASVHNTLARLEAKGLLAERESRGHYAFEDDHLRSWIDRVARTART